MFRTKKLLTTMFFFALSQPQVSQAVSVTYDLIALGGNAFRYDYTISNDGSLGAGVAVELFDISFDASLYQESSLVISTSSPLNTEWDENILASAPGIPAIYDAFALNGGIAGGASATGFSVSFTWLGGPQGPGGQVFEIFDPVTFALLEAGTTNAASPVPVPGTMVLMVSGLLGFGRFVNRNRR